MSFSITISCAPSVNAAMQQNHIPLFRDLRILNDSDTGTGPLVLKIHAAPEIEGTTATLVRVLEVNKHEY